MLAIAATSFMLATVDRFQGRLKFQFDVSEWTKNAAEMRPKNDDAGARGSRRRCGDQPRELVRLSRRRRGGR
jgi:hypothetical protein